MPRFNDDWLIDRVLFDYVGGGSCACCGMQFLPGGTADLIGAVSDLETDQAKAELAALEFHPWPADLRDQIWADRVRLRQKMKKDMTGYAEFWSTHGEDFENWSREQSPHDLKRWMQLPRTEIMQVLRDKYNVHSAFGVVMEAVMEQVAHFDITGYPVDARGNEEIGFEKHLVFDRRGGYTMNLTKGASSDEVDEDMLEVWLQRMKTLKGPKLLEKGKKAEDEEEEGEADAPAKAAKPGFQGDRRIVRLLIARYWADNFQKRYLQEKNIDQKDSAS